MAAGPARSRSSVLASWALATGAFGVAFGSAGVALGVPGVVLVGASVLVFSPSVQFAALGLATGGNVVAALATGVVLASRLFVVALPFSEEAPGDGWRRFVAAHLVIDASVLTALAEAEQRRRAGMFASVGATVLAAWVVGTTLGVLLGSRVGDLDRLGLDAALPTLFLVLLVPLLADLRSVVALAAGGLVAVVTTPLLPEGVPLLLAAVAGSAGLLVGDGGEA